MTQETEPIADKREIPGSGEIDAPNARRIHWHSGLGILLGGAVAEAVVLALYADDDTLKIYITLKFVIPVVGGLFILWWFLRSGFSWFVRGAGALIAVLGVVCFSFQYRIDGFTGAMIPIISSRSDPSPEDRVARYFDRTGSSSSPARGDGDAGSDDAERPAKPLEITDYDWPRFRGAQGDGIVRGVSIRTDWKQNPPQSLWKHPIGPAWSTFAVVGDMLFTQEQRSDVEAVVCYDASTGRQIWVHTNETRYSTLMGGTGPRATPTVFDSRVYSLGATGLLNCLDARTGEEIWGCDILQDAGAAGIPADNLDWGMAGSPLIHGDLVVVNPGGTHGRSIIAHDRLTGEQQWAQGGQRAGYAAPRLETIGGQRQLLVFDADGVAGYDPDGEGELWRYSWTNSDHINVAQPIVKGDNLVFVGSGYGTGSVLLEVSATGDGQWQAEPRWRKPGHFKLKFNDAVYKDGYLYGLDEGILACIEFETGKKMWKRGRYGHGQLLLIDDQGLLLIQAENGDVALVPATPDRFEEITRFHALDGKTWNHPVLNRGLLYVRNHQQAGCYDLRPAVSE